MYLRAAIFTTLAVAISWGLFYLAGWALPESSSLVTYTLFMFGPLAAALVTALFFDRGSLVEMLALRPKLSWWWLLAWFLPTTLVAIATLVTSIFPGAQWVSPDSGLVALASTAGVELTPEDIAGMPPFWVMLLLAATFGGAMNAIFAMGEEAGWRGYLWTVLRPVGFWRASGFIGIIWGLWHFPVILDGHNYGSGYFGYPWLGILMMVLFTLGLSPLLGLLRDRTDSVWPAALFHGCVNAVAAPFLILQTGAGPLISGFPGLAGVITLAASALVVALLRRPRW